MIFRRDFTDDVKNTAKSFKNWNSCMADKPCKIIAIVGICLACIVGLWLIGGLLTCVRQGVTGISGFICWCCNCNERDNSYPNNNYNHGYNPHMTPSYQPQQPMMYRSPPDVVYQPIERGYYEESTQNIPDYGYYSERNQKSNSVFELEQDFDLEGQRIKAQQKKNNGYVQAPYPT
ncbi:Pin2p PWA37_001881 [Arxiozyma heterogenica]|uniref:[PSI+] induction protein 2 n=1 Tax=Arxiozyma heterogenica TaxID=278026 RepID=A0AAN7WN58_9SACH|nr:hypothetical protein RI543_001357 [Kazachstania heterogenica]